jgi:hypothetical protein
MRLRLLLDVLTAVLAVVPAAGAPLAAALVAPCYSCHRYAKNHLQTHVSILRP